MSDSKENAADGAARREGGVPTSSRPQAAPQNVFDVKKLQEERNPRDLKMLLLDLLNGRRRHRQSDFFKIPGPMPRSISRGNLPKLRDGDYWVAEKSDGDRFVMFYSESRRRTYLLGRKFEFLIVPGDFYNRMFQGEGDTMLDGELVRETNNGVERTTYLVFDAVILKGKKVSDCKLVDRLKCVGNAAHMFRTARDQHTAPFAMQSKTFKPKRKVGEILSGITRDSGSHSGHPVFWFEENRSTGKRRNMNDGLIFTPSEGGYMQRKLPILKWKSSDLQTIDVAFLPPAKTSPSAEISSEQHFDTDIPP
uniref:mRNA capping enzyme adenylation domain-containing protein n=2 Tax=Lotharella globosa TaxID=91324 RepID=A0A7S4DQT0_9EUKA